MPRRRKPPSTSPHLIDSNSISTSRQQPPSDLASLSHTLVEPPDRSHPSPSSVSAQFPSPLPLSSPSFSSANSASSTLFLPPHYSRHPTSRPSSPSILSTLFHPVLKSLSRPSSPPPPPPASPQRSQSSIPSHFPPRSISDPAPTIESQGFLLYISSLLFYASYLIWSLIPGESLKSIGIEWFPSQEWALLIPSWITMSVVYVYLSYSFLNMSNNETGLFVEIDENDDLIDSYSNDPKASVPPPLLRGDLATRFGIGTSRVWFDSIIREGEGEGEEGGDEAIPPLYDLPLELVNRVLYE
ncbi:hypothetical protein JCM5353_007241 [Sporobolomyces roseus]